VPAPVIGKSIPTAVLLAQVVVAKHPDHLTLGRQEARFGRTGLASRAPRWAPKWASAVRDCNRLPRR
jgi:transposase